MFDSIKVKFENWKNKRTNAKIVREHGDMGGYGQYCMYHDGRTIGFHFPNGYRVYTSEFCASYARRHGIELMQVFDSKKNEIESAILKKYSSDLGYGTVQGEDIMRVLAEIKELPAIV